MSKIEPLLFATGAGACLLLAAVDAASGVLDLLTITTSSSLLESGSAIVTLETYRRGFCAGFCCDVFGGDPVLLKFDGCIGQTKLPSGLWSPAQCPGFRHRLQSLLPLVFATASRLCVKVSSESGGW